MSSPRGTSAPRHRREDDGAGPAAGRRAVGDGLDAWLEGKSHRRSPADLPKVALRALRFVMAADRRTFLLVSVLQTLAAALLGVQLWVGRHAVEALLSTQGDAGSLAPILTPLFALAAVTAVAGLVTAVAAQLQRYLNEKVQRSTWDRVLDVTGAVPLETYESPGYFEHLHRVQVAAVQRPLEVARGIVGLTGGAAGVVVLAVTLTGIDPLLPLLLLLSGVPALLLTRRRGRNEFAFVRHQATVHRERNYVRSTLTSRDMAKEVRAFGLVPTLRRRYDDRYERYVAAMRALVGRQLRLSVLEAAITSVALAASLVLLAQLVVSGRIDLADAAVAAVAVRLLAGRIGALMSSLSQLYESSLFLRDMEEFERLGGSSTRSADPDDGEPFGRNGTGPRPGTGPGAEVAPLDRLCLTGVSLTYPSSTEPALQDVDLEVRAGEVVALVGENGSGKTTLAKVVAQLYRPTGGTVWWNGAAAGSLPTAALRDRIAVVFQDFAQFELTAHENIALGRPDRFEDRARALDAARRAGALDFLAGLPDGMDTLLSTSYRGGTQLSIGQWQRVALARAIFRDASLVVLDEPSSALDPRAEAALIGRLHRTLAGRSALFVTHRFSTVRAADRIYVLHEGRIAERGTHDELMARRGLYAELFELQAAAYLGRGVPS